MVSSPPPRVPPSRLQMVTVSGGSPFPLTLCLHFRDQVVSLLTWLELPGRSGDLRRMVTRSEESDDGSKKEEETADLKG